MDILIMVGEFVAIVAACWAIISGVGAWKREFIGKRKIELAEEVLATFFELKDSIAYMRSPFGHIGEGKARKRDEGESPDESRILDRGYVIYERYDSKSEVFNKFRSLKYRFMASFGHDSEEIFNKTNQVLNRIFSSANILSTHYWQRQGRVKMGPEELKKHLQEMRSHEDIFYDQVNDNDEIRKELSNIQNLLDSTTSDCFKEPSGFWNSLFK